MEVAIMSVLDMVGVVGMDIDIDNNGDTCA